MPIAFQTLIRRWLQQRHFFAGVAIPIFFVFIMALSGFKNLVILLHEGRTMAVFTEIDDSGRGHVSSYYRYEVNGHTYTGSGAPDHQPFTPPFKVGDTFEVRYSKLMPFFSIAQDPTTVFGQFLVGSLFLLWAGYMATRNRSLGK
jgi:hypothetical protein